MAKKAKNIRPKRHVLFGTILRFSTVFFYKNNFDNIYRKFSS